VFQFSLQPGWGTGTDFWQMGMRAAYQLLETYLAGRPDQAKLPCPLKSISAYKECLISSPAFDWKRRDVAFRRFLNLHDRMSDDDSCLFNALCRVVQGQKRGEFFKHEGNVILNVLNDTNTGPLRVPKILFRAIEAGYVDVVEKVIGVDPACMAKSLLPVRDGSALLYALQCFPISLYKGPLLLRLIDLLSPKFGNFSSNEHTQQILGVFRNEDGFWQEGIRQLLDSGLDELRFPEAVLEHYGKCRHTFFGDKSS